MSVIAFEKEITAALKEAMMAKNQVKMDCLRAMKSALKYKDVEKSQAGVTEEEALQIFQSMIKQRKDSIEQFEKFGKPEAAAKEKTEIDVIAGFMPKGLTEDELKTMIAAAIQVSGAVNQRDLGKVMKELKPKVTGRADGKVLTDLVKAALPAA